MSDADPDISPHAQHRVVKGFLGIVSGSVIAQLLAIAAIPLLARLYTPDETAQYALLLGVSAVIASFASLRLDLAIPLPGDLSESRRLFWLAIGTSLVVVPVLGIGFALLRVTGVWQPSNVSITDAALVAVFVIILCTFTAASQLAVRVRAYGTLGRIPVLQMVGTLAAQIGMGLLGLGKGLFAGGAVGRSLGIVGLMRAGGLAPHQRPDRREARRMLREYWRFPALFAPAGVIQVLGGDIAALMLPALYGLGQAGLYAMALRISAVPGTVLTLSAGQVFLGEFARATERATALRVFFRWSLALAAMALGVAGALWVLAPVILPWFLGDQWAGTAQLAQYTGLMAAAAIFGSPVQHVWTVRQQAVMQFMWNLLRLCATAATLWIGAASGRSIFEVAAMLAGVTCAVYLVAWAGCLYAAARPGKGGPVLIEAPIT